MRVTLLGSGNTATVLAALIHKSQKHQLVQVISRHADNAAALAATYNVPHGTLKDGRFLDADLYIIALQDAALDHIGTLEALKGKFVIHTSGSVSINALKPCSDEYGVLYPLQTLSRFNTHTPEVPFMVDGNTQEIRHKILGFAKSLSDKVIEANDKERIGYHVAAVFVSNFANHMFALAELFCKKERLDFQCLLPLINEVNQRVNQYSPFLTQTGPAIRDDVFTLNKHLQALTPYPELRYAYLKMTESIIKVHGKR